ncbi:uncharacterized protein VTP21DRAFT_7562 [Calcarisporiella thermophila]|uniref:uncharacterized protein n=1 Tax=Calcarisporiella thermophila TaxID=911321 RepID=UPI003742A226
MTIAQESVLDRLPSTSTSAATPPSSSSESHSPEESEDFFPPIVCRKGCRYHRSHILSPMDLLPPSPLTYTPPASPPPSSSHLIEKSHNGHLRTSIRVESQARARIPTAEFGEFSLYLYHNTLDDKEHLAIVYGDIRSRSLEAPRPGETERDRIVRGASPQPIEPLTSPEAPLVRIHSECFTGETVHSARCDCGEQLDEAMRVMAKEGKGVVVYLRQEGRGIGLLEKLKAYNIQDLGYDTLSANLLLNHPADARSYEMATAILDDLGIHAVRLLTNNPDKIAQVEADGLRVVERVPMVPKVWEKKGAGVLRELDKYLKVKVERMGHILDLPSNLN